jgi:phospholipase C
VKRSRYIFHGPIVALFLLCPLAYFGSGCGGELGNGQGVGGSSSSSPGWEQARIRHVIVILQENRTPDNLFHGLPNADIANGGFNSRGQYIRLAPVSLAAPYDLDHSHRAFLDTYDGGKMDGADKVSVDCLRRVASCIPPHPQFVYIKPSEVKPYFELAEQYAFADRMFQTNQGPSFPAHQFMISGTSAPSADSDLFAAENPFRRTGPPKKTQFATSGCTAPTGVRVNIIDPEGNESKTQRPCFEHATLMDLLDAKHVSWRYYSIGDSWNALWNGPSAIRHLRFGPDWSKVIAQNTQVLNDIAMGQLPAVSWVIPSGRASDHPGSEGTGPSWVAAVVNAIGRSPYWWNTAIFITWDDWGGFYDHVAPPIYNSYEYGFRVPLIVVSPYSKPRYVSHVTHDFGSILRFIETRFDLGSLGYADSRADDLSDCFDFHQPRAFTPIAAPLSAQDFLADKRPPTDPDDD